MSDSILRLPSVMARVGLSRSSIYLKVSQGTFPAPIKLGERASGWLTTEVDAWVAHRIEARRADFKGR